MTKNEIENFFDQDQLLDKKFGTDGGDSCQRMGMYFALLKFMKNEDRQKYPNADLNFFYNILSQLQPAPGIVIRHTRISYWASDFYRGSIDQTRPYLVAAGAWGFTDLVFKYFKGHAVRLWLFTDNFFRNGSHKQNHGEVFKHDKKGRPVKRNAAAKIPDPTFVEFWSLYIRGLNAWPLYPLLLIFDLQNLLSAMQNRWLDSDNHDIINQATITLYNRSKYWTPWAWLAHKIHSPKYVLPKVASYFGRDGDLKFFVQMFEDAYRGLND